MTEPVLIPCVSCGGPLSAGRERAVCGRCEGRVPGTPIAAAFLFGLALIVLHGADASRGASPWDGAPAPQPGAAPTMKRSGAPPAPLRQPPPPRPSGARSSPPPKPSAAASPPPSPPAPPAGHPAQRNEAEDSPSVPIPSSDFAGPTQPRRIRIRDLSGRDVVARIHGGKGSRLHVMLPDGQLGVPDGLAFTDDPFVPDTMAELAAELLAGPFRGFKQKSSQHYLALYRSSDAFAEKSVAWLEDLYERLADAFRRKDIAVHEAEFPLVAVIFPTEREFRAYRRVDAQIQAYYEINTNRIYFYETSDRDEAAPEVAAMRRPQTVAHEGTHQILQNIGVQPRLADWPAWLVEGLAEYCSSPIVRQGVTTWAGLGAINAMHLATIRDLDDPLRAQVGAAEPVHLGRAPNQPLVEYLASKPELTPTDYALAWAMTHYLAMKKVGPFTDYLRTMSQMPPLEPRSPEEHLQAFRAAFGQDLRKLDREIDKYLAKLRPAWSLPYYAVLFEQQLPNNLIRRAAMVSQSPSMIRQWVDTMTSNRGAPPMLNPIAYPNRVPADAAARLWMRP